jgi:predicted small secreted protein
MGDRRKAAVIGVLVLPLACMGCALVDRAGRDLQTAGGNIQRSAQWVGDRLGAAPAAPPVTEGRSSALRAEPCSWANVGPNC